jgi:hypothetical protein
MAPKDSAIWASRGGREPGCLWTNPNLRHDRERVGSEASEWLKRDPSPAENLDMLGTLSSGSGWACGPSSFKYGFD